MALHKNLGEGDIHIIYNWSYADQTKREAAEGFHPADIGKLAVQLNNFTFWVVSGVSPVLPYKPTWLPVGQPISGLDHPAATADVNGFMSSTDKTKLDGIQSGATATPLLDTVPVDVTKAEASAGIAAGAARCDHKHDITAATPPTTAVQVGNSAAEGSATSLARSDHQHAVSAGTPVDVSTENAAGSAATFARSDHAHAGLTRDANGFSVFIAKTTPVGADILLIEDSEAAGIKKQTTVAGILKTVVSDTVPVDVTKAEASAGVAAGVSRQDHKHDISTAAPAANAVQIGGSATEGSATSLARSDHLHAVTGGSPVSVGTASADGDATTFARSNHVHAGLTRGANDFSVFAEKTTPAATDLVLIEDSEAAGAKKYVTVAQLASSRQNDFRLTGISNTPVLTADNSSLTTIYLTPFVGNQIALYNGKSWNLFSSAEVSLAVTGRTTDLPFDVFAYNNAGVVTLEFTNWSTGTTRATALIRQDGVWCRSDALTRRYVGTCRPRSATTFSWVRSGTDAPVRFDLFNADNRVPVAFTLRSLTNTWTYTAAWRQCQASANYQADVIVGLQEECLLANLQAASRNASKDIPRHVGIGYDSTTTATGLTSYNASGGNIESTQIASMSNMPTIGRHYYAWLEASTAGGACTWIGNDSALRLQSGMTGMWRC